MDRSEKLSLVQRYESCIETLINFVKSTPTGAMDFRPSLPDAWTIREHAVHFLDADAFAYGRLRFAVTQPGIEVVVWDEVLWQARARYETADALSSLETARGLRQIVAGMARAVVDADWESFHIRHPERGRLTLADVFKTYIDHADFHMAYLRRNLEAFRGGAK